jgi:DNA-directed RNA polymerase beta' subunit
LEIMNIDYSYYSEINTIEYYVLGNEENYIDSKVEVNNKELFKGEIPVNNGCYDAALGTTSYSFNCTTCLQKKSKCPGHFGNVELRYPVKNPLFRDAIIKWLKVVCFKCGRLLVTKDLNIAKSKVLEEYVKQSKSYDECSYDDCQEPHPNIIKDKYEHAKFYIEHRSGKGSVSREELFNHQIRDILRSISNDTVMKMQIPIQSHPKNFILDIIRVPPNTIRPDIRRIGGSRSNNNDVTALMKNIVDINEQLPNEIPKYDEISNDIKGMYFNIDLTYYEMIKGTTAANNQVRLVTTTNKTPSSIASRIPRKTGRIRKSLMGKRTRMMLRSVITGDNALRVDELGIPKDLARSLQIPETVRSYNKDKLNIYFINRKNVYPGCSAVYKALTNTFHRIEHLDPDYKLQEGDILHRDLVDGDYVGFNRQPSLLFSNIGAHRIVIMEKGSTIKLNVSVCSAYNADFDGDAANVLVAQNIQSRAELKNISWVGNWSVSYQNHSPFFGNFQDSLIGSAEITRSNVSIDKWHAMQMFSNITPPTSENFNFDQDVYTGRDLVSLFLPKINYPKKKAKIYLPQYAPYIKYDADEIYVQINRGKLISGVLDKSTTGQKTMGSIFHIINNEYGANRMLETIYNFHQLIARFFLWSGFTVGIRDINIGETAMNEIKAKTALMKQEAQAITDKLNRRELVPPIGMTLQEFYESEQLSALEPADNFVTPILNDPSFKNNSIAKLIFTGSKGSETNLININGGYGQITINGRRPIRNCGYGRTSPYFPRYDTSPESLGFIDTSYREGVKSAVFPFAAGDARHSSISNALSTSVSGAQSRISVKNLESIVVNNLRQSVKDENIVQLLYADDGVDTRKTENVKFLTVMISDTEMEKEYHSKVSDFAIYGSATKASKARKVSKDSDNSKSDNSKSDNQKSDNRKVSKTDNSKSDNSKVSKASDNTKVNTKVSKTDKASDIQNVLDEEFAQLIEDRKMYRNIFFWAEDNNPGEYLINNALQMPVNVFRIIEDVIYNYSDIETDSGSMQKDQLEFDPIKNIKKVAEFCEILPYIYYNTKYEERRIQVPVHIDRAVTLLRILIRTYMCSANLVKKGIKNFHVDIILNKIRFVFKNSLVDYGSTVGIIAAQCLSEPLTQYVLDSKHRGGGGGGTQTNVVDRIKEILGTRETEKMKNTSMLIMVKPEYEKSKLKVREIANHIEMMDFERFISTEHIFFEELANPVHPDFVSDKKMIDVFLKHNAGMSVNTNLSKWCIRYELDHEELIINNMKLDTIITKLRIKYPDMLVMYSPENSEKIIVRCYLSNNMIRIPSSGFSESIIFDLAKKISETIVRGIKGIIRANVDNVAKSEINEDGSISSIQVFGIYTIGSNLEEVLDNPYVDKYRTQTDSIKEFEDMYGIEAAREKIIREIRKAMNSDDVTRKHTSIFADEMCYAGKQTSIQKTGLQIREANNVSLRVSFQSPIQVLEHAATNGLVDSISSVSAPLINGQTPNIGTCYNNVSIDERFVEDYYKRLSKSIDDAL